ncbi:MAG TPA: P-loop NTPase [Syntrophales bacterium]|nr:P-loop NTPase [Syntrophales bacterium]HOS76845.1 P-loop NTPase [Syntrophales bacterium]
MKITVASGKGGTGKTTFCVNLAYALAERGERIRLLDCDVEEPNDHLFVRPKFDEQRSVEALRPVWIEDLCTGCGDCAAACRYNAMAVIKGNVLIFNELCHACGLCSLVCPEKALIDKPSPIGTIEISSQNQPFFFAHGTLNIGEVMAPAIIRKVKTLIDPEAINLIDASPGTSCPVVETVDGVDVVVLVTEPTPFGLNDLKLAVNMALKKKIPTCIVVNRSDGTDRLIAEYAERVHVPIVGRIPFKRAYAETYSSGAILTHVYPEFRENLLNIFSDISRLAGTVPPEVPADEAFCVETENIEPFTVGKSSIFKEIAVISGKGGSGKTTLLASLAMLADNKVLADNDVDAADLHLLLGPIVRETHDFVGGLKMAIDPDRCTACGQCAPACRFGAIHPDGPIKDPNIQTFRIDEFACEGCGVCEYVCAFDAVETRQNTVGKWFVSGTDYGPMVHARLGIAEENSGRLVTQVRNVAAELAKNLGKALILSDGPPGTGCPVIASVSGADLVLVVTEPTVSGVHDMQRVLELAAHFRIPSLIVVNKADLNAEQTQHIKTIASEMGAKVLAEIPFDRNVNDALMAGKTVIEYGKGPAFDAMVRLWGKLETMMKKGVGYHENRRELRRTDA